MKVIVFGVVNVFVFFGFEWFVWYGMDWIWNDLVGSDDVCWCVVLLVIVGSVVFLFVVWLFG